MPSQANTLNGPSIQVDPLFPYYQNRSAESIAEEIQLAGYGIVHYFVVNENVVNRTLIDAFHARGLSVWAMVIGNGTFSTERFPKEWPEWQMGMLRPVDDGFWRFSPFSEGYRKWKKKAMAGLVREYPFNGIEIAEPYFPEWDGINRGVYGDVGPLAAKAFHSAHGLKIPEFEDSSSHLFYLKNPDIYAKWVEFRVEAVNGFIDDMINGPGGVRESRPDIAVATWSLAVDDGEGSSLRLRELQGLCASSMISKVKPDIHYLQTHWPDWIRGDLPADYARNYLPLVEEIRSVHPNLPLGVQADIGSGKSMIKSEAWWEEFQRTVKQLGFRTWTAYEYHIGGYMYEKCPVPVKGVMLAWDQVMISFNKRIDEQSCTTQAELFRFFQGNAEIIVNLLGVKVDGNRIILRSNDFPEGSFSVEPGGVRDTPDLWLYKDSGAKKTAPGIRIEIQLNVTEGVPCIHDRV